jgi:hypothetical protein
MNRPKCLNDIPCDQAYTAAGRGHMDCLTHLIEIEHQPLSPHLCSSAAIGGNVMCLTYLRQQGCEWDWKTAAYAAKNGNTECLEYAIRHGCPRDIRTFSCAVIGDNVDCLECLRSSLCPIDESAVICAVKHSKLQAFKYLHEKRFPINRIRCSRLAFGYRSTSILAYIRDYMTNEP